MTDAVRELFEMLTKKEKSGSDYTGKVTRVENGIAYVQFDGSDIPDTPVTMSIGAKAGDEVRIRVADGRAWITGNDTAPPAEGSRTDQVETETKALLSIVSDGNGLVSIINQTADKVQIQAEKIELNGYTKIDQGELGGFTSNKGDTGCQNKTSAAGGHRFATSLWSHSSDGTYEYEVGIRGDTTDSTNAAFYVRQLTAGGTWNNSTLNFYVQNSGKLYAKNAEIDGSLVLKNGTMSANMTGSELVFTDNRSAFANYENKISGIGITSRTSSTHYATMTGGDISVKNGNSWASINANIVEVGNDDSNRSCRLTASAAGNAGIYDYYNSNWIICSNSSYETYSPHPFRCYNSFDTTLRYPVLSSNQTNQGISWLGGTGTNTLSIRGEWNASGAETKTVAVSSSDIRLKDNIEDSAVDALSFINQIRMRSFRWKEDGKLQEIGVIADELEQLDPMLVVGGGQDPEGHPIYKSINNLLLISYLTKAVQQLSAKVDALSAELSKFKE